MRQRSKRELLQNICAYEVLKKDQNEINKKQAFYRMGVEWSTVLWKEEKWSTNAIAEFLKYINTHNVADLPEERRNELKKILDERTDWTIESSVQRIKQKNAVDEAVNEFRYIATQDKVNYCLLSFEYLIAHGYARKRINRIIKSIFFYEKASPREIGKMRMELFDHKGVWIELSGDKPPEDARII